MTHVAVRQAQEGHLPAGFGSVDYAVAITPLKRAGADIDVADAVVFLASRRASYITGQMLMVDGGLVTCRSRA